MSLCTSGCQPEVELDTVFPAPRSQVLGWHPNRVLFAIVPVLCARLSLQKRVRRKGKQQDSLKILQTSVAQGFVSSGNRVTCEDRKDGRDCYRRIMSVLTGTPTREVRKATAEPWKRLSKEGRDDWASLAHLFTTSQLQKCAPDPLPKLSSRGTITWRGPSKRSLWSGCLRNFTMTNNPSRVHCVRSSCGPSGGHDFFLPCTQHAIEIAFT